MREGERGERRGGKEEIGVRPGRAFTIYEDDDCVEKIVNLKAKDDAEAISKIE